MNIFNNKKNKVVKVPLIIQLEDLECGAACLAMVLAYHGKWLSLEQVRADCDVSRDGVNAYNIVAAARNYGLKAEGLFYDVKKLISNATFPCIAYWEKRHFIVVKGIKNNKIYINDPGKGSITMPIDEFKYHYSGIVLLFEPTESFVKEGKSQNIFSIGHKKILEYKELVYLLLMFSAIISVFSAIRPTLDRIYVDKILTHESSLWTDNFLLIVLFFGFAEAFITMLYNKYSLLISNKINVISCSTFFYKVLHLPMRFFMQRRVGDIQNRNNTNSAISNAIVNDVSPIILDFIKMIVYLVIMIVYSFPLTVIGLTTVIINLIVSRYVTQKIVNKQSVLIRNESLLYSTTLTGIDSIENIKASGAENGFLSKWSNIQAEANNERVDILKLNYYYGIIPTLLNSISGIIITFIGGYFVMQGHFTVGMVLALSSYLTAFTTPTSRVIQVREKLQELSVKIARVDDVMNYKDDENVVSREFVVANSSKINGDIELKNVTFGYARLSEPVIKDFSLSIKKGSMIALVGKSGSGKTTISKLISGLYAQNSGTITYGGKTLKEIDRDLFCSSVAIIDQNIITFKDTIANNIRFFDKSINDNEILTASRDAQIYDEILCKDGGFDSIISDDAREFSGGQKQKLEIARVLAQNPTVLILDEFTSALDNKTEAKVIKAIRERGITCFVISHRLSVVTLCDEIVVLDNGKIVGKGTNDELYNSCELYREFVDNE